MLRDLPSYANRTSQRARHLNRTTDISSYMLLAGRPEFAPLKLGLVNIPQMQNSSHKSHSRFSLPP
jgi:hypothetical protein